MRAVKSILVLAMLGSTLWAQADPLATANERLSANDFKGAEQAFREATEKDPKSQQAWFGLGQALQEQGNAQAALEAFEHIANPAPNLAARLAVRRARAFAKLGQTDKAFATLDAAVNAGFGAANILESTPDFASLKTDARYAKLLQRMDAVTRPCMHDARFRAFDFWVGEWDVRPTGQASAPPGRSSIQKILEGCVVFEQFTSAAGNYHGKSFNVFDANTGRWYQHYVDSTGAHLQWDGEVRGDALYYTGVNFNGNGQKVQDKLTFFKLPTGGIRQLWEQSPDGKQWTVIFDGEYTPHK